MATLNFTELWEDVDNSLDQIMCLLKGAVCIDEQAVRNENIALGLVHIAFDRMVIFERQLRELNNQYRDLEKKMGVPLVTPARKEGRV